MAVMILLKCLPLSFTDASIRVNSTSLNMRTYRFESSMIEPGNAY